MSNLICCLVGVPKYESEAIDDLPFCSNDSSYLENTLKDNLFIDEQNIRVLGKSTEERVNRIEILKNLQYTSKVAKENDILFYYFSGHGFSSKQKSYLVGSDADLDFPADTCIEVKRIKEEMNLNLKDIILVPKS